MSNLASDKELSDEEQREYSPSINTQEGDEEYDYEDEEEEDDDDDEDDEEEPKLRYRRIGAGVRDILEKDNASTLRVTDKFVVRSSFE
jgi:hypothetical protein